MSAVAIGAAVIVAGVGYAASSASASSQSDAMGKASAAQANQYDKTTEYLNKSRTQARADMQPYVDTGNAANNQLSWEMGTGGTPTGFIGTGQKGALSQPYSKEQYQNDPLYTPMVNNLQELQATPGYQFQLDQGLQSVNNSAAANGSLLSGRQLKDINNYAQGQASTGYQAAWQRAQQAYNQAFSNNNTTNNNTFNRLQSMSNNGQSAAQSQAGASMSAGASLAGASSNYGNNQAALAMAQGQNQANMYTGIGNAVNSGIGAYSAFSGNGGNSVNNGNTAGSFNTLGQQISGSITPKMTFGG
jgi:hypothetical protein